MSPELVEEFVRAFQKEVNSERREDNLLLELNKRELAEVNRKRRARAGDRIGVNAARPTPSKSGSNLPKKGRKATACLEGP
jgi:hypothetical protein